MSSLASLESIGHAHLVPLCVLLQVLGESLFLGLLRFVSLFYLRSFNGIVDSGTTRAAVFSAFTSLCLCIPQKPRSVRLAAARPRRRNEMQLEQCSRARLLLLSASGEMNARGPVCLLLSCFQ
jgi:hypothetical protein